MIAAISLAAFGLGFAQPSATPAARMFDGETLKYEGKGSKYKLSMAVADLTFSAVATPNSNELVIKSEAVSKGSLLKLFRYSFLQQYQSTVDLDTFRILKTTKHDVQKERVRDSEAKFDYAAKRVSFVETDPKDAMRPPRRIASEIGDQLYDMISAIYGVRMLPLAVGKKFSFSVSDSGLVYKVPFAVTAREKQDTVFGKVWCFRVEPEIFGTDRLIERQGKMVIWMTDDARHTPVRAQIKTEWGRFDIKLKSSSVID
ncbi:MAG: DUF3108 domain-containing protein [Chloracidobacterium sp.]|nr:DUF3108 domain-containing protein [Chloracidobacterium sp.]